jgi:hypothetical protein
MACFNLILSQAAWSDWVRFRQAMGLQNLG